MRGTKWLINATSKQQCLDACSANSSCVAVEWSGQFGCWGDDGHFFSHEDDPNATTFVLVRPCDNPPAGNLCDLKARQWPRCGFDRTSSSRQLSSENTAQKQTSSTKVIFGIAFRFYSPGDSSNLQLHVLAGGSIPILPFPRGPWIPQK